MSFERRNAFRFQLGDEPRDAVLEIRRRRVAVELLDHSATGFSVKAPLDVEVEINELVAIETSSGRCDAVVARVQDHREHRRLGLQRISDLSPVRPKGLSFKCPAWLKSRKIDGAQRHGAAWLLAAAVMALAAIGWMAYRLPRASEKNEALVVAPSLAPQAIDASVDAEPAAPDDDASVQDAATTSDAVGAERSPAASATTEAGATAEGRGDPRLQVAAVSSTIHALGKPTAPSVAEAKPAARATQTTLERLTALRASKAASELGLSEQQKLEISRLMNKVSAQLARVRTRWNTKSRASREAQMDAIVADAEARVMAILSPEQQIRWQAD